MNFGTAKHDMPNIITPPKHKIRGYSSITRHKPGGTICLFNRPTVVCIATGVLPNCRRQPLVVYWYSIFEDSLKLKHFKEFQ